MLNDAVRARRRGSVYRQIDALCGLSLRQLDDWYRTLLPRLLHNRKHLFVGGRCEARRVRERLAQILAEERQCPRSG